MIARVVDTHAHLMDAAFEPDREAVIERAVQAGVERLVLVGYDLPSSRAAIELARKVYGAVATVGIHPNSASHASEADFEALAVLARAEAVVAIGETGLDYYREYTPHQRQREALEWHARLAEELDLPLIIHNREADADVAEALEASAARRRTNRLPGVLHCFSSTDPAYLERMLTAGYAVSFAGPVTYKSAPGLREMAARVPLERVLVETDCPYLPPASRRGRRNEPAFIRETADCLADVLGVSLDALASQLWANSLRVFPALADIARSAA